MSKEKTANIIAEEPSQVIIQMKNSIVRVRPNGITSWVDKQ